MRPSWTTSAHKIRLSPKEVEITPSWKILWISWAPKQRILLCVTRKGLHHQWLQMRERCGRLRRKSKNCLRSSSCNQIAEYSSIQFNRFIKPRKIWDNRLRIKIWTKWILSITSSGIIPPKSFEDRHLVCTRWNKQMKLRRKFTEHKATHKP